MITLKTLPDATAQEVFDQVTTHLLQQNSKSMGERETCLYRGDGNKVCAAGCLISDDEYNEQMEYQNWKELSNTKQVPEKHISLITSLQEIHDSIDTELWTKSLQELAKDFDLKFNN